MARSNCDVRFTPESGHSPTRSGCPLWANSGHSLADLNNKSFEAISVRNRRLDRQNDLEQGPVVALRRRSKSTAMTFDNRAADIVVFGERHLRHLLRVYANYYNRTRTHLSLNKDSPAPRAIESFGRILPVPILGGLHHRYVRI
jgi:hypothetical protein